MCERKKLFINLLHLFSHVKNLMFIVFCKFVYSYGKFPLRLPKDENDF